MKFIKLPHLLLAALAGLSITLALTVLAGTNNETEPVSNTYKKAYFAGGCFCCVESNYEKRKGVIEVISGYSGGEIKNPTYKQVSSGKTEHLEAVEVIYDPEQVFYQEQLDELWFLIDPTDAGGSFVDRGPQYRSAVFYTTEQEKQLAEQSRRYDKPIVTEVRPFEAFYKAEDYH